jgi:hypothetical protein
MAIITLMDLIVFMLMIAVQFITLFLAKGAVLGAAYKQVS